MYTVLNSSTIDELGRMVPKKVGGVGQQRGMRKEVSMATLRAATTKGTITLNPISGILTRPEYQREGGEGKKA